MLDWDEDLKSTDTSAAKPLAAMPTATPTAASRDAASFSMPAPQLSGESTTARRVKAADGGATRAMLRLGPLEIDLDGHEAAVKIGQQLNIPELLIPIRLDEIAATPTVPNS